MRRSFILLGLLLVCAVPAAAQLTFLPARTAAAGLPACGAARDGFLWTVTDLASTPSVGDTVTTGSGGGAVMAELICENGTGWRVTSCPDCVGGAVDSVFGRTGAVVAESGDYDCGEVSGCVTGAAAGTHAPTHELGGADEVALDGSQIATGEVGDARIPAAIARDSELHAEDHAARHSEAGADEVLAEALGSACTGAEVLGGTDPVGGVECQADDTGTDDQVSTEVPHTPGVGGDWTDPDPTEVGGGLDQLADRLTDEEAKVDDDVPESGDFGAAASLEADGSLSAGAVGAITEIAAGLKTGSDTKVVTGTAGGNGICAEWNADGDLVAAASAAACGAGAGGGGGPKLYSFQASGLLPIEPAANSIPPLAKDEGTNADVLTLRFDDSTDECRGWSIHLPGSPDTGASVTFTAVWYAVTAAAANVVWDARHLPRSEGESWDAAFTTETAAADASSSTQDQITVTTWTETWANLGWAADDWVEGLLCRDADNASDTLTGDAALLHFSIEVPQS